MTEPMIELLRLVVILGIVLLIWRSSQQNIIGKHAGYRELLVAGIFITGAAALDFIDNYLASGRVGSIGELVAQAADYSSVLYLLGFIFLFFGLGKFLSVFAKARSEQQQASRQDARLQALFEVSPDMIFIQADDGRILDVNDNVIQGYGYSRNELQQLSIGDLSAPGYENQKAAEVLQLAWENKNPDFEWCARRKNGEEFPVEVRLRRLTNIGRDGQDEVLAIVRDISVRKRTEEVLLESEQRYRSVVEEQTEFVVRWLANGTQTFVNESYCRYFGKTQDEMIGANYFDLTSADDHQQILKKISSLTSEQPVAVDERRVILPRGDAAWQHWSNRAIYNAQGDIVEYQSVGWDITDRKRIETEVLHAKAEFEAIVNSISDAVIYADINRNVIMINPAVTEIFGYSPEEVVGKSTAIFYAESADYLNQGQQRFNVQKIGNSQLYELNYRRKNGSIFIGETLGRQVKDVDGNILGFIGVIRDISEKRQAEELATRLGRIVEESLNEVYLFDDKSIHFIEVNRGARENLGYSMEELRNLTPVDIKPDFNLEHFEQVLEPLRRGDEQKVHFETVHQRKDGTVYPVEVHLQHSGFGDVGFFLAIILDISERKNAEEALRKHQDHLEELVMMRSAELKEQVQIIDQTHDAVVSTDLQGHVVSWNKGAERLFGYSAAEAKGRHISFLHPAEDQSTLENEVINPLRATGQHEAEFRLRRRNGENFFAHLSLSMLYDERGSEKGMVAYAIDISVRKRTESLLQRRSDELAAANKELEGFSYSVSHDLRSPLRAIDGFSAALLEEYADSLDEQGQDYLRRVRNGTQRMAHLIDDLLQLSRVARGELEHGIVDLSAMAREAIKLLEESEPQRNVRVDITPSLRVHGDKGLLRIALDNLLGNAWKYTRATAKAHIVFGVEQVQDQPVFFVRDNGVGFDMQFADKLFGAFQRLHRQDEFEGTGIGLATVQRILHRHGGWIRAEAEVGKGATFYFSLPKEAGD